MSKHFDTNKFELSEEDKADEIGRLTELDIAAYLDEREARAKALDMLVQDLDRAVREHRKVLEKDIDMKPADLMVIIVESAQYFHTADKKAFALIWVDGHRETLEVRSEPYRRWLINLYFAVTGRTAGKEIYNTGVDHADAISFILWPEGQVHFRTAEHDGKIYYDLGDASWRAVEIDSEGWRVIDTPPVYFRHSDTMLPLPPPEDGGTLDDYRSLFNIRSEGELQLLVSCMAGAVFGKGPQPALVIHGEYGAAKTSTCLLIQGTVDPNAIKNSSLPNTDMELFVFANSANAVVLDNVSSISARQSDTLCRLVTGGSLVSRKLYTNGQPSLMQARVFVIINGIAGMVNRADLIDRSITLELEPIPDDKRLTEQELQEKFTKALPAMFGMLCTMVSRALVRYDQIDTPTLGRMADACKFGIAVEDLFWDEGSFMRAYMQNRGDSIEQALEADNVAFAVFTSVRKRGQLGPTTMTELKKLIESQTEEAIVKLRDWPKDATRFSVSITNAQPVLRKMGVHVERFKAGAKSDRTVVIWDETQVGAKPITDATDATDAVSEIRPGDETGPNGQNGAADFADGDDRASAAFNHFGERNSAELDSDAADEPPF